MSDEFVPQHVLDGGRDYRVEGNKTENFIGVSPEYMTYANPANEPLLTPAEKIQHTNQYDNLIDNTDDDGNLIDDEESDEDDDSEVDDGVKKLEEDQAKHDAEVAAQTPVVIEAPVLPA